MPPAFASPQMHFDLETLPAPSPADQAPIGLAELTQLRKEFAGDGIGELVEMFKEEGRPLLARISAAIEREDADGLRRAAHQLKGACGNFGARPLEAICEEMETAGRAGKTAPGARLLANLHAEFHRAETALEEEHRRESEL